MLPVLIALALGTFGYLWWKSRFTSLTRDCRWRMDRRAEEWHCVYCGARVAMTSGKAPTRCARRS